MTGQLWVFLSLAWHKNSLPIDLTYQPKIMFFPVKLESNHQSTSTATQKQLRIVKAMNLESIDIKYNNQVNQSVNGGGVDECDHYVSIIELSWSWWVCYEIQLNWIGNCRNGGARPHHCIDCISPEQSSLTTSYEFRSIHMKQQSITQCPMLKILRNETKGLMMMTENDW